MMPRAAHPLLRTTPIKTVNRWFERHVTESPDGCWIWHGARTRNGYGQVTFNGRLAMAHRALYEYMVATVPAGLDLDHLCRVRACVNPYHLDPVTRAVNLRRGDTRRTHNSSRTHCPQGHPYDDANTRIGVAGRRHCRTCDRGRAARNREARLGTH